MTPLRSLLRWLAIAGGALQLSACEPAATGDEMFPLDKGHQWLYRLTTHYQGQAPFSQEMLIRTIGSDTIAGETAWRRYSDTGAEYWLRADDTGVFRVASKYGLDPQVTLDKTPRFVLKKPYAVDTSWSSETTTYLLEWHNRLPKRVSAEHPALPMTYRIEAVNVEITTPAGTFSRCLQVAGSAAIRLYVDTALAWRDVPLTTTEWYCPEIGLVKLERTEPTPSRFMKGGKFTMELIAWE